MSERHRCEKPGHQPVPEESESADFLERERERMRTKQLCEIVLMTNGLLLRLQFLSENRKFASSCLFITLATKGESGWTLQLTNSSVVS